MDLLRICLLDLHNELRDQSILPTVGERRERTHFTELPEPRANNDIGTFFRVEELALLAQAEKPA